MHGPRSPATKRRRDSRESRGKDTERWQDGKNTSNIQILKVHGTLVPTLANMQSNKKIVKKSSLIL